MTSLKNSLSAVELPFGRVFESHRRDVNIHFIQGEPLESFDAYVFRDASFSAHPVHFLLWMIRSLSLSLRCELL